MNWKMPLVLKNAYLTELDKYHSELKEENLSQAWNHLERAHIIGQAWPKEHSFAHWTMLKFGVKIKSTKEILGQIPRLMVGGVKSFVGRIPVGNTGGSNVPPLRPMEIPEDIQELFKSSRSV